VLLTRSFVSRTKTRQYTPTDGQTIARRCSSRSMPLFTQKRQWRHARWTLLNQRMSRWLWHLYFSSSIFTRQPRKNLNYLPRMRSHGKLVLVVEDIIGLYFIWIQVRCTKFVEILALPYRINWRTSKAHCPLNFLDPTGVHL